MCILKNINLDYLISRVLDIFIYANTFLTSSGTGKIKFLLLSAIGESFYY